jgi:hypothetical protein
VVLPQAAGAVWAGALLVFLYVLSDFGAVSIVRYDTLTRSIYAGRLFDQTQSIALSLLLGLLAVAVVATERLLGRRRVTTPGSRPSGRCGCRSGVALAGHGARRRRPSGRAPGAGRRARVLGGARAAQRRGGGDGRWPTDPAHSSGRRSTRRGSGS